ncbi:MAG: hypothetical protein FWH47_00525 [Methanomassiliicoccaceae archaeon]|nr:hypothetical protein [Methanomassiliicoccaceae archaeon]
MRVRPEASLLAAAAVFAVGAAACAAMAYMSAADGNAARAAVSAVSLAVLAACAASALLFRARLSALNGVREDVKCLRLKRPGLERAHEDEITPKPPQGGGRGADGEWHEEGIVPKGKMPGQGQGDPAERLPPGGPHTEVGR